MAQIGVKMKMNPAIAAKLSSGNAGIWRAAHDDGSKNKINGEEIAQAASYSTSLGVMDAIFQGIKKAFRNRGKTREDFAAEKEAARINQSVGALEVQLKDYIRAAQQGAVEEEDLDDLIATLAEIRGYFQAGKLIIQDEKAMSEICDGIADYTAALAESKNARPAEKNDAPGTDLFSRIRDQLILQKKSF